MPDVATIIELVDYIAVRGLPIVAGSLFVLICLWTLWEASRHLLAALAALREWIPRWFSSQIELNEAYKTSFHENTEALRDLKILAGRILEIVGSRDA
jgi:hypothetical protein